MKKAISYMLFRLGSIPKRLRPALISEGIIAADEGMRSWMIARNVKGPGRRFVHRATAFSGCLVVTEKRIVCYAYLRRQMDIPVDDPRLSQLFASIPRPGRLTISFDASAFRDGWSGVIEFRFRTEMAQEFHNALMSIGAQEGVARTSDSHQV